MHNDGSGFIPAYDYEETIKIVEHLLERSDNSDYAVTPKLPSLNEVVNLVSYRSDTLFSVKDITLVYETIKKLGNFA